MKCATIFARFDWRLDVQCPYPVTHLIGTKPFCQECFREVVAKGMYPGETPVTVLGEEKEHATPK